MSAQAVDFLNALAQALAAMTLYPSGHRSVERALDTLQSKLLDLHAHDPRPLFSFLGDEVIYGNHPLREMRGWEWSARLADVGVQRLQFDNEVDRAELEGFVGEILARITLSAIDTAEARHARPTAIRFGSVGVRGEETAPEAIPTATVTFNLKDEADTVRFLHQDLQQGRELHLQEAEAVVRGLAVAMHSDQQVMLPLLKLRTFDEYTTTHSINVSVLAMGLAEWVGLRGADVRALGMAGLLHDLGKVKIPLDVLTKRGALTAEERIVMNRHPSDGARIIISTEKHLDLAAVVAYEHHIMLDGGGYPTLTYARDCHYASKLVHVCDVYDALRTNRPYRDAWQAERVLSYIEERAGSEFDPGLARQFVLMMRDREGAVAVVAEDEPIPAPTPPTARDAAASAATPTPEAAAPPEPPAQGATRPAEPPAQGAAGPAEPLPGGPQQG
jgi:putative nucleotidyltransferase with HDIG domain